MSERGWDSVGHSLASVIPPVFAGTKETYCYVSVVYRTHAVPHSLVSIIKVSPRFEYQAAISQ